MSAAAASNANTAAHTAAPPASFRDVTGLFRRASDGLDLGSMVHGPQFSLYRSMSAVELMDPKMDTGRETTAVPSVAVNPYLRRRLEGLHPREDRLHSTQ